jgi:hypothetical protein
MTTSPLTVARKIQQDARQDAARNAEQWMAARRRDAARNGYRGPLTRAELAQQAARQASQGES